MATIWACGGMKGGGGKTTVTIQAAGYLYSKSFTVHMIDADGQGTLSLWAARGGDKYATVEPVPITRGKGERWIGYIQSIQADYVIIDLPPNLEETTQRAASIADLFLIPVALSVGDLAAMEKTLSLLKAVQQERNGSPACVLIPNRAHARRLSSREAIDALNKYGVAVTQPIGDRAAFIDSFTSGDWVGSYDPKSKATQEITSIMEGLI